MSFITVPQPLNFIVSDTQMSTVDSTLLQPIDPINSKPIMRHSKRKPIIYPHINKHFTLPKLENNFNITRIYLSVYNACTLRLELLVL